MRFDVSFFIKNCGLLVIALGPFSAAFAQSYDSLYDRLFPTYAEYCAGSKIQALASTGGGIYGHAVVYLKGACRDPHAPYPKIQACSSGGVGLSVNNYFANVNWIAIDDRSFFFEGRTPASQTLTPKEGEAAITMARQKGYLKNVRLSEEAMSQMDPADSIEHFVGLQTVGTDYALNFGRDVYCVRMPVTPPMMQKMIDFYNSKNTYHFVEEHPYIWDSLNNNCTHTAYNALAAAGFWPPKNTRRPLIPDLAIPFTVLIETISAATQTALPTVAELADDPTAAKTLIEQGWLLNQPGVLLEIFPLHQNNQVYETHSPFRLLSSILAENPIQLLTRKLADPRHHDLKIQLHHSREKILAAQREMRIHDRFYYSRDARGRYWEGQPYSLKAIFDHYEVYLANQLRKVEQALAQASD